jgi:fucose permease
MKPVTSARIAVSIVFLVHGLASGTWVSRIPAIQEDLHLGVGTLGVALLGGGFGSLLTLLPSGAVIGALGSRRVTLWTGLAACAALAVLALPINAPTLFGALMLWGSSAGSFDVAMNAQGSTIEQRRAMPIMSSLHGLWSVGSMTGAATGALLAALGVSFRTNFVLVAPLLALIVVLATQYLVGGERASEASSVLRWPRGDVLALAAVVFCAVAVEGAMFDWAGVYLRQVLSAPEATAASAVSFFSVAMAIGRLSGDVLTARIGAALLARVCAGVAAVGVLIIVGAWAAWVVFAGLVVVGLGLSVLVPLAFGSAGRVRDLPSSAAIATVAMVGYSVFLVGPPTIGLLAEQIGLRGAFVVLPALLLLVIGLAATIRGPEHSPA